MCVHQSPNQDLDQVTMSQLRKPGHKIQSRRTTRRCWKTFIKEIGFAITLWIALSYFVQVANCSPLLKRVDGNGLFAEPDPDNSDPGKNAKTGTGFISGFVSSFSMIIVSELGDKTFFIAAVMAMKHSRVVVFSGAITALALMTVLSALFGFVTTFIPRIYTYYISTALFAIFGFKMLYDGVQMSSDEGAEELEEVQLNLRQREADENTPLSTSMSDDSQGKAKVHLTMRRILTSCFSKVYIQALTMTFLAEWGDRSQLATVVLAARENILGICIGGVLGHSICTGLAVVGGRMLAQRISVKSVTIIGGFVFLGFAVISLFMDPNN